MDGFRVHRVPGRQASKMPRENGQAGIAVRQDLVGKDKKSMDGGVILQCRQYGIRWTNSQVYAFDDGTKWLQSGDFEGRIHTKIGGRGRSRHRDIHSQILVAFTPDQISDARSLLQERGGDQRLIQNLTRSVKDPAVT